MRKLLAVILLVLVSSGLFAQGYKKMMQLHRAAYTAALHEEERAPLNAVDVANVHFFAPTKKYIVVADIVLLQDQKPFQMPTYDGTSKEFVRYAIARFTLGGGQHELTLYKNLSVSANAVYDQHLFLPFTDLTTNKESYGGGRYLDLQRSAVSNGKIEIDFNKAYNPYCAFSDGYRCPVPPQENDLAIAIKAGEKKYTGQKKRKPKETI